MPVDRSPYRRSRGLGGSATSRTPPSFASRSPAVTPGDTPTQPRRWGSNLSTERRERTVVWASCLQKVQALRRGGSWRAGDEGSEGQRDARDGGRVSVEVAAGLGGGGLEGGVGDGVEDELLAQLDLLSTLTYPNSSIRSGVRICSAARHALARRVLYRGVIQVVVRMHTYSMQCMQSEAVRV